MNEPIREPVLPFPTKRGMLRDTHLMADTPTATNADGEDQQLRRAIFWLEPSQVELASEVVRRARLTLVGVGCPSGMRSSEPAAELDCPVVGDLRNAIASEDADLLFFLSPGELGRGGGKDEAKALRSASQRGLRIASLEPLPTNAMDFVSGGWGGSPFWTLIPLPRTGRAWKETGEALTHIGDPRFMSVECAARSCEGGAGSRLIGALDLVIHTMGEPEGVAASFLGRENNRGRTPGDSLRDLRGDFTAHLRFADGRGAVVVACGAAARWTTRGVLVGENGSLRLFDDGYEWTNAAGEKMDSLRLDDVARGSPHTDRGAAAIAAGIASLFNTSQPQPPMDCAAVLTVAQAILLAARTSQIESPATIRAMAASESGAKLFD